MNQSIRCEPLPFPLVSEKAVAEGATLFPRSSSSPDSTNPEFGDVLDSEMEEKRAAEKERKETDAWTLYGVAPTALQILHQEIPALLSGAPPTGEPGEADGSGINILQQELTVPANLLDPPAADSSGAGEKPSETPLQTLLEGLKPAEQKLPTAPKESATLVEQIAEIPPEPAKKASGMVAAQGASMLSTSHMTEETAAEQSLLLSTDHFEAVAFEQPIVVKAAAAMREPALHRDLELAEFTAVDAITPEWSSFEGISEASDVQSVRPTESIEIAQAIRSHVQLLKSSGQEKLDVVLRPDANTELRLHVEKVNGQILVQARCDRGDFARLESNWNAVQQTLATQGVRVESLQHGAHFQQNQPNGNNPSSTFQQQSSHQQQENNFIEPKISVSKATQPSTTNGATVRGWQSWA